MEKNFKTIKQYQEACVVLYVSVKQHFMELSIVTLKSTIFTLTLPIAEPIYYMG